MIYLILLFLITGLSLKVTFAAEVTPDGGYLLQDWEMTEVLKTYSELEITKEEVKMYKTKLNKETEKVKYWISQWEISEKSLQSTRHLNETLASRVDGLQKALTTVGIGSVVLIALTALGGLILW